MKQYEITYLTKEENSATAKPAKAEIEALGGKITAVSSIGQKQLVYPIKKEKEAYFTTALFTISEEKIGELNRKLSLKEEILRYLIIIAPKVSEKIISVKPSEEKVSEEIEEKKIEEKMPEKKPEKEEKEAEKEVEKVKEKILIPKPEPKIKTTEKKSVEAEINEEERLKALDEKLDELLKE